MTEPIALINTKLIESLTQIILSLTDEEQQLLAQKINFSSLSIVLLEIKKLVNLSDGEVFGIES